jgi:hypothetical protein
VGVGEESTDIETTLEVDITRNPFMEVPRTGCEHGVEPESGEGFEGPSAGRRIQAGVFDARPHDGEATGIDEQASGINGDRRHVCLFAPEGWSDSICEFSSRATMASKALPDHIYEDKNLRDRRFRALLRMFKCIR